MFKVIVNDGEKKIPNENIVYIVGKTGIFLKKKVGLINSVIKVDNISFLNDVEEWGSLDIPKIPAKDTAKIIDLFKKVYLKHHGESIVLIFFNEKKKKNQFKFICPKQKVSMTSLHYEVENIKNYNLIGTIHSHGSMSAFHSHDDDKDEKNFDGLHITIGNIESHEIDISCSIVVNGMRFLYDACDYMKGIKAVEEDKEDELKKFLSDNSYTDNSYILNNSLKSITCSKEWLKQIKVDKIPEFYFPTHKDRIIYDPLSSKDFNPCSNCPFLNYKIDLLKNNKGGVTFEDDLMGF